MNNYDDYFTLIENYLDSLNHEYQSHDNQIEIYSTNKNIIIINIKYEKLLITSDQGQDSFSKIDDFFRKLDSLLINF
tara:strand:- start:1012 stop:1242 length:231 start_codon:yes stop_codon:yes gene_type:complete